MWHLKMENFRFSSRWNQNSRPRSWPPREHRHHHCSEKAQWHHRFYRLFQSSIFCLRLLKCFFNTSLNYAVDDLQFDLYTSPDFKWVSKKFQADQTHMTIHLGNDCSQVPRTNPWGFLHLLSKQWASVVTDVESLIFTLHHSWNTNTLEIQFSEWIQEDCKYKRANILTWSTNWNPKPKNI